MRLRSLLILATLAAACQARVDAPVDTATDRAAASSTLAVEKPSRPLPSRQGSSIARSPANDALYVADEDHRVLRRLPLPVDAAHVGQEVVLSGAPAQVLPLDGRVLVTLRDPGMLLVLREQRGEHGVELIEEGRVKLADDAWGVAVDAEARTAVITSAWSHRVTAIDLRTLTERWSVDVAREPRGVTVIGATVYVSHLMGADLTRIDLEAGATVARIKLPTSPLRAPLGTSLDASLGYALVPSPDGSRLYAPRHALGAMGERHWYGAPTVDVLRVGDDVPLAPARTGSYVAKLTTEYFLEGSDEQFGVLPFTEDVALAQPRAAIVRESAGTLLVASEGEDTLVEMSLDAIEPALKPVHTYRLGARRDELGAVRFCGAPSGVALSEDERTAYVFCRSTYDLAIVPLRVPREPVRWEIAGLKLAEDPLGPEAAAGRRLFYNASDGTVSGGLGCAGCHPDGRDDGHTWHEVTSPVTGKPIFVADAHDVTFQKGDGAGFARQTPMLAGRVAAEGPYGWHAQSPDLRHRAMEGFQLHRWDGFFDEQHDKPQRDRADAIAAYLRAGLVAPQETHRELTPREQRGQALFLSESVGCATCHVPATEYTDRVAYPLDALPTLAGFEPDHDDAYKTPGLRFVGGTAPYFHDGSARTLEDLVARNGHRMGRTESLSAEDRAALVAFLKTL